LLIVAGLATDAVVNVTFATWRAAVPFVNPAWSEGPLLLELRRIAAGQAEYTAPYLLSAYDYGPVYPYVLNTVREFAGLHVGIVALRGVSMAVGLLSAVPLGVTAWLLTARLQPQRPPIAAAISAVAAGSLGLAVVARTITFTLLHPDDLVFLLVATIVALYFAIALKVVGRDWIWALAALGVAATFTKQNTVAVVPLLLVGLALSDAALSRRALFVLGVGVAAVAASILAMPPDMRAWAVFVPLAHTYEFNAARAGGLLRALTVQGAHVGLLLLLIIPFVLAVRNRRSLVLDGAALVAVGVAGLAAYFKRLVVENNLLLFAAVTVPYAGALIGTTFVVAGDQRRTAVAAFGFLLAVALVVALPFPFGSPFVRYPGRANHIAEIVHRLCSTGSTLLALNVLSEVFDCPQAVFALDASLTELRLAYPRYDPGPTLFDRRPTARYVISAVQPLPFVWQQYYAPMNVTGTRGTLNESLYLAVYETI